MGKSRKDQRKYRRKVAGTAKGKRDHEKRAKRRAVRAGATEVVKQRRRSTEDPFVANKGEFLCD